MAPGPWGEWLRRMGGGRHPDWSPLLPKRPSKSIDSTPIGPHPYPDLQLAELPGGGTHRGLVQLKGWERPRAPSVGWSLQLAGATVCSAQELPPVLSHGLCECGNPAPRPRHGVEADGGGDEVVRGGGR